MANIEDYINWRGDITFEKSPFNDVDNLLICELAYVNLKGIVPEQGSGQSISVKDASDEFFKQNDEEELRKSKSFIWYAPFIMKTMAQSERFGKLQLSDYVYNFDDKIQTQFAAVTIRLDEKTLYIAFMGTDDTIIGWKENFNMSFLMPVPAQEMAAEYINDVFIRNRWKNLIVGGHSKGGNLAIYGSVKSRNAARRRITRIYDNDGPGFDRKFIKNEVYQEMKSRIISIVPYESIIGMLLEHDEKYKVVKSSDKGIMQHSAVTWQVLGTDFETERELGKTSRRLNTAITNWINGVDMPDRVEFVDALFEIFTAGGAQTMSEIQTNSFSFAGSAFKRYNSLDKEKKALVREIFMSLTAEYGKAVFKTK